MMKRLFWFMLGVVSGMAATVSVQRRLQSVKARYTPPAIADRMSDAIKRFGSDVAESARAGRSSMTEREHTIRSERRRGRVETPVSV